MKLRTSLKNTTFGNNLNVFSHCYSTTSFSHPLFKRNSLNIQQRAFFNVSADQNGDSHLHLLLKKTRNAKEIVSFIEKTGFEKASSMANHVNNRGELPIDLIENASLSKEDKEKCAFKLFDLMKHQKILKHNELIEKESILKKYKSLSPRLKYHIELACDIINETRQCDMVSKTHPDINDLSEADKKEISNKVQTLTNAIDLSVSNGNNPLSTIIEYCKKNHAGDCGHYTCVATDFLMKKDSSIPYSICSIENGNHIFGILGTGENAVVYDAWKGDVFLKKELSEKLTTCRGFFVNHTPLLNVLTSFNPAFHSIKPEISFFGRPTNKDHVKQISSVPNNSPKLD